MPLCELREANNNDGSLFSSALPGVPGFLSCSYRLALSPVIWADPWVQGIVMATHAW